MSKNYSIELLLLTNESKLAASKVYANSMQHTETTWLFDRHATVKAEFA